MPTPEKYEAAIAAALAVASQQQAQPIPREALAPPMDEMAMTPIPQQPQPMDVPMDDYRQAMANFADTRAYNNARESGQAELNDAISPELKYPKFRDAMGPVDRSAMELGYLRGKFGMLGDDDGGGKELKQGQADKIIDARRGYEELVEMASDWERTGKYDIGGAGWATSGKQAITKAFGGRGGQDLHMLETEVIRMRQAGRKAIDVGNLTAKEQEMLKDSFPKVSDSPELKRNKVKALLMLSERTMRKNEEKYRDFGYSVPSRKTSEREAMTEDDDVMYVDR